MGRLARVLARLLMILGSRDGWSTERIQASHICDSDVSAQRTGITSQYRSKAQLYTVQQLTVNLR
jgi:hypothetical protein